MKLYLCAFSFILFSQMAFAQNIPQNPNKTDKKGLRQGKWTICYNQDWNIVIDCKSATYYRLITYQDDKPIGKVTDHYRSGKVQMEARLLADRPQEIFEGVAMWYREDGTKEIERVFKNGQAESEKNFDTQGKEINYTWEQVFESAEKVYHSEDYAKAVVIYELALPLAEKEFTKTSNEYVKNLDRIGTCYLKNKSFKKSENAYLNAKNIQEKRLGKNDPDYLQACFNLLWLYQNQGKLATGESLCIELKNAFEKYFGKESPEYALYCDYLAVIYVEKENYGPAEPLFLEAKRIYENVLGKENPQYIITCQRLAHLYLKQKRYNEAENLYLNAKNTLEKIKGTDSDYYAESCNDLATVYEKQRKWEKAEHLYLESKKILENKAGKESVDYSITCFNLTMLYEMQNRYLEAEPLMIDLNKNYLKQIDLKFINLSEKEKEEYYQDFAGYFQVFNHCATRISLLKPAINGEVYNNVLATKSILFNTFNRTRQRIVESQNPQLIQFFEEWKNKREFISRAYQMKISERQSLKIDINELESEINELEKELSQKSEQFAKANDKTRYTWQDVQKKLKQGEAAIELIRFQVYDKKWTDSVKYMALIVKPESQYPEMVILENGKELEGKYAKNYLNSIKYKKANRYSYQQYWAKIQAKLNGIKKIYLSVDGVYNSLNINTLYNIETQKYLGEELEIQLLSNSKDLITAKTNNTPIKNATLIGFPDYNSPPNPNSVKNENPTLPHIKNDSTQRFFNGDNITELLGTKTEVNNLESILQKKGIKTDKYLAAQATEELVKKLNNPQILHIATHGFFLQDIEDKKDEARGFMGMDTKKIAENPLLRSGLLFANAKTALQEGCDGILTAYEAMNLNLDNTDLVVMSACETGLGEIKNGEGVYGLQRAFQQAGAKTVLMSLWTVSDEATQELMTLFYQNLITKKQSKRLAFQNAQNELKKKFPEPYYWGAFVMVGE